MNPERDNYQALLESLADGVEVDWTALDAAAATDAERGRYRNLRLVARVAELHRTLVLDDEDVAASANPLMDSADDPTTWGHLSVRARLAAGAFGRIYRAHDPQLNREVALKLLRGDISAFRPVDHLLGEARTLAKVRHPNVVTVYGADVRDGRAGLWMELVHGQTLDAWLRTNGAMGSGEATAVSIDLCRALAAVHGAGLVHGDVKAQNVMREQGGRIVLMDFGAGRAQGADATGVAGTPMYLAPEVLAGEPPTPRSDLYSLGVLIFHLLTGAYPYTGVDLDGLRAAHAGGTRSWLRDLRPDLPDALVQSIERAINADPTRRFATAGEMERALASALSPPRNRFGRAWIAACVITLAGSIALLVALSRYAAMGPTHFGSIAVLPFSSADGGTEDDHLVDGLTSDVIREMQRFDLEVKRGAAAPAGAVSASLAERLGAEGIVRGDIRRAGSRTAVRVAILRGGSAQLWAREYDVVDAAVPSLPRIIATDIAAAVGASARAGAPPPRSATNYEAYAAYQRGRLLLEERSEKSLRRSLEYFDQAARLDPTFAQPWAGKADAYTALGIPAFGPLSPLEARRLAKDAALKALEIDPNLVEAHTSLAFQAFLHDWDWATAQTRFDKALSLNPQYALAHHWYAEYLNEMHRFDDALKEVRRAQELEPLSILIHRDVAWHLFCQRRYDEAVTQLRETLTLDPDFVPAITLLARALAASGHHAEALTELEGVHARVSKAIYLSFRGNIEALAGQRRKAESTLAELRVVSQKEYVPPYYVALIHTALGRSSEALSELERAYAEQDSTLVSVDIDPRFDALRPQPRFQALIARMRFPRP